MKLVFFPLVLWVSQKTDSHHWGLVPALQLPSAVALVIAILLLDYTLYIWHRMNHTFSFLWRFHNAHHVDLDVDVSTASRFHFGELILSAGFRSGQIALFGIDVFTLILFETLVTTAAQFHHSNINFPFRLERLLNNIVVTPRMHGIHHSIVQRETESNFSTIFSIWDHLHGSVRLNIPQSEITTGVASYRDSRELSFLGTLRLPFRDQRPWKCPDGSVPERNLPLRNQSEGIRQLAE